MGSNDIEYINDSVVAMSSFFDPFKPVVAPDFDIVVDIGTDGILHIPVRLCETSRYLAKN